MLFSLHIQESPEAPDAQLDPISLLRRVPLFHSISPNRAELFRFAKVNPACSVAAESFPCCLETKWSSCLPELTCSMHIIHWDCADSDGNRAEAFCWIEAEIGKQPLHE